MRPTPPSTSTPPGPRAPGARVAAVEAPPCARRLHDERGAIAPILAAAVAVVVVASLAGVNAASLSAARTELGRAADLAALAGAAATPLVGALASDEPRRTTCEEAAQLLSSSASPLAAELSAGGELPACSGGVSVVSHAEWSTAERVGEALRDLIDAAGLDVPAPCDPVVAATLDPVLLDLTATDCERLAAAVASLPESLAPAVVTPRVRVTVEHLAVPPVPLPVFAGPHPLRAEAVARRRFKNLVVLPPVRTDPLSGIARPVDDLLSGVPAPLRSIDPNPSAAEVRDGLLPVLRQANESLSAAVDPHLPPGYSMDLSQLLLDVTDLYDPPAAGAPSPLDVAAEAARTGDPVVVLRLFRMPVLGIPAFDFTAAYLRPLADGRFEATPIPVADLTAARGLFGATLVR